MRWIAKALVQNTLAKVPGGVAVNGLLQRYGTRSVVLTPEKVVARVARITTPHLRHHERYVRTPLEATTVMEIGTGFTPLIPVGLFLAGVRAVKTYDIARLTTERSTADLIRCLVGAADSGLLLESCPWVQPTRVTDLRALAAKPPTDLDALLDRMGITYTVGDATTTGLADETIDLVVTNNVFEHIPPATIRELLEESARIGRDGAVISHHIDIRDHYAKFDRRVSVFNSLRFSSRQWRFLNSRLEPQNRLRHSDYVALITGAGFEILSDEVTRGPADALARTPLATRFRRYALDDLRIVDMWVAARKSSILEGKAADTGTDETLLT